MAMAAAYCRNCSAPPRSSTSSLESFGSVSMLDFFNTEVNETTKISDRSGFHVFTTMMWVRRATDDMDGFCFTPTREEDCYNISIPNMNTPDSGLLRYHRDRMSASAKALGWHNIPALERSEHGLSIIRSYITVHLEDKPALEPDTMELRRLKIMVDKQGHVVVDSAAMGTLHGAEGRKTLANWTPKSFDLEVAKANPENKICKVYIDTDATDATLFTVHKTSHRDCYNESRERFDIGHSLPTVEEVILYNEKGEIMEGSLCTLYFYRKDKWVTPASPCGGNLGVTRRVALEKGFCREARIQVSTLQDGEMIWLSNAARGFFMGQICLKK